MAFEDDLFDYYDDDDDIEMSDLDNGANHEEFDYTDDLFDPTIESDDTYGYDEREDQSFTIEDDYDSVFSVSGF